MAIADINVGENPNSVGATPLRAAMIEIKAGVAAILADIATLDARLDNLVAAEVAKGTVELDGFLTGVTTVGGALTALDNITAAQVPVVATGLTNIPTVTNLQLLAAAVNALEGRVDALEAP